MFGHQRGAFTGATETKVGLFEHADGGTLFLDEVGELPLTVQPKLLRAVEYGDIQRVGSARSEASQLSEVADSFDRGRLSIAQRAEIDRVLKQVGGNKTGCRADPRHQPPVSVPLD